MIGNQIIGVKLSNTDRRMILLGSLSYFMRGNLSNFQMMLNLGITLIYAKFCNSEKMFLADYRGSKITDIQCHYFFIFYKE
jgi:hypothetical protein